MGESHEEVSVQIVYADATMSHEFISDVNDLKNRAVRGTVC